MRHSRTLALFTLLAGLAWLGARTPAADDAPSPAQHHHDHEQGHHMQCARACDDCARICDACSSHCAHLVADGKKDHLKTLGTCTDCAVICRAASTITSRKGPFANNICSACAEACKRCGEACDQHEDSMMKRCAQECKKCEKACRDMLQHIGAAPEQRSGAASRP